jgi:hypothetical protein
MADTLEQIAVQLAFQLGFVCSCRVLKDYPPDGPVCHGCRVTSRIRSALQSLARERDQLKEALLSLRNEASALIGFDETAVRAVVGITNVECLKRRIRETDALLARLSVQERARGSSGCPTWTVEPWEMPAKRPSPQPKSLLRRPLMSHRGRQDSEHPSRQPFRV